MVSESALSSCFLLKMAVVEQAHDLTGMSKPTVFVCYLGHVNIWDFLLLVVVTLMGFGFLVCLGFFDCFNPSSEVM